MYYARAMMRREWLNMWWGMNSWYTRYTQDEDAYLRAHPGKEERAEVARFLGRPIAGVTQRLSNLGLLKDHRNPGPRRRARDIVDDEADGDDATRSKTRSLADPLALIGRPAWFEIEGGESRAAFARRLMGGK
jgi:hypothetical protein